MQEIFIILSSHVNFHRRIVFLFPNLAKISFVFLKETNRPAEIPRYSLNQTGEGRLIHSISHYYFFFPPIIEFWDCKKCRS